MNLKLIKRDKKGYYRLFRVDPDASLAEVDVAYRKLRQRLHPDKCSHKKSKEIFQYLQQVYYLLSDEERRKDYDPYWELHAKEWTELSITLNE